ncbi:MAG: hypothetical protein A2283_05510 [Lentisphaerae bacterium RIFOXYA12_FULL_48_11]|nr:MAG: hypothetical protein A2283_05510 [Lentisphaerae bacterium RIFOXYA12_FULL_48_11]
MNASSRLPRIIVASILSSSLFAVYSFGAAAPAAPAKAVPATPAKISTVDSKTPVAAPGTEKLNPNLDLTLKKALDGSKLRYDVNPEGTCRLVFNFGKERSHQVFVTSKKESFMGTEYRRIWATSWKSKELPSAEIMAKLLQDSATKKIGGWEMHRWSDGYRLILAQKLPADASNAALEAAIKLVVNGADYMEEQLTNNKDEF